MTTGDILISVGDSHIKWYRHDGTYVATLNNSSGSCETVSMFADASGNVYDCEWTTSTMSKFNSDGSLATHPWGSAFHNPWGVVGDDNGNIYVGNSSNKLLKFDTDGTLVTTWTPTGSYAIHGIDLSADGSTIYYAANYGGSIKRFDVTSGSQLDDFTPYTGNFVYSIRLLPSGGALGADVTMDQVHRYDDTGAIVQNYSEPNNEAWAAICLDPDGLSFWGLDYGTGKAHRVRLSDGALLDSISAGVECSATGMAIVGERCRPANVTTNPASASICSGGTATFISAATGSSPTVQWQRSTNSGSTWSNVSGATSDTLSVTATYSSNGAQYRAVYTAACGADTSTAATLTVGPLPTISVSVSPTSLTPVNHNMRDITATVTTSGCTTCGSLAVTLVSVTSSEPDSGNGDNTTNDIQGVSTGTDDRSFSLRAERSPHGNGRTYTATYRVTDCAGNTADASATVVIPGSH